MLVDLHFFFKVTKQNSFKFQMKQTANQYKILEVAKLHLAKRLTCTLITICIERTSKQRIRCMCNYFAFKAMGKDRIVETIKIPTSLFVSVSYTFVIIMK